MREQNMKSLKNMGLNPFYANKIRICKKKRVNPFYAQNTNSVKKKWGLNPFYAKYEVCQKGGGS